MTQKKKLIEVAMPLEAINREALRRKQKAPKGWPTSFHKWWAQRPLASARAVIFAQMVDDPSAYPDLFKTEREQKKERGRLFKILEDLVQWDNTANQEVLSKAREAVWESWRRACAENADHPRARELFNREVLPAFHDPFAGSGSLPLSAQWLGMTSYATDLNPVAVLINKALIEVPPRFAGKPPVNREVKRKADLAGRAWQGAQGLAEDVRYYSQWMREEAEKRIGHLYPKVTINASMAKERPDLKAYVGESLTVIAWLWARTVRSPNPAFSNIEVPLVSTFVLSSKAGKEVFVQPVVSTDGYEFEIKFGKPNDDAKNGTKLSRGANFKCVMSGEPIAGDHIKSEAMAGRLGARLIAVVVEGATSRIYLAPTPEHENTASSAKPDWRPDLTISGSTQYLGIKPYGMDRFDQLFTNRQLVGLSTFSDLVIEAKSIALRDALSAGLKNDSVPLREGGGGALAYSEAIACYLACVVDRMAYYGSTLTTWLPKDNALRDCMPRQALAMTWDYAEGNPFGKSSIDVSTCSKAVANYLDIATTGIPSFAVQGDAQSGLKDNVFPVVSTDPPYYDNVPYADLSDFFYVWLRRSLKNILPDLFATVAVPKAEELVAFAYRHSGKEGAEEFFLSGMTQAMHRISEQAHPAFPVTIYYAFKQAESDEVSGVSSTGWETFLDAVIRAGFLITGTWPMRTEGEGRMRGMESNALASSIVLVCRKRGAAAPTVTRRDFLNSLKTELPAALTYLQAGNIAPVDLAQAAIGPGMAVYTRYAKVLDAEGKPIPVRAALALINQVLDEALAEQEGDFDADTRWALAWFEQMGFDEGEFGVANVLAQAKNTAVNGLVEAGIISSGKGKVHLLKPSELPADWDPTTDNRLTVWEMVHHLVRVLEAGGEAAAAALVAKLGSQAEIARELCYRLYTLCERKKRANEAMAYNGLVQSWPEIVRLARETPRAKVPGTDDLFDQE